MKKLVGRCSFCGAKAKKRKAIVSTHKVGICNECIVIATKELFDRLDLRKK